LCNFRIFAITFKLVFSDDRGLNVVRFCIRWASKVATLLVHVVLLLTLNAWFSGRMDFSNSCKWLFLWRARRDSNSRPRGS